MTGFVGFLELDAEAVVFRRVELQIGIGIRAKLPPPRSPDGHDRRRLADLFPNRLGLLGEHLLVELPHVLGDARVMAVVIEAVERTAAEGNPHRFGLPRPMWRKPGCDFSFSGLKTAVRQAVEKLAADDGSAVADLCASFQRTVGDVLADRCANAFVMAPSPTLVVAGGVAANLYLRRRLEDVAGRRGARLVAPPVKLCTDNGAMIAWAGAERLALGLIDTMEAPPRARWLLDANAKAPARYANSRAGY